MNTSPCDDLDGYLDNTLSEQQHAEFESHMTECPRCQSEVHLNRHVNSLLVRATTQLESAPPVLVDRISMRIRRAARRRMALIVCGAAAAIVLFAVCGRVGWDWMQKQKPVPIVEKSQNHPRQTNQPVEETNVRSDVQVTVGPTLDGIVVPLNSDDSRIAIFWIYPSKNAGSGQGNPGLKPQ